MLLSPALLGMVLALAAPPETAPAEKPVKAAPYDQAKAQQAARIEDPDAATHAYLGAVSPERRARTKSYALGNYVLSVVSYCLAAIILLAVIGTGFSARLRNMAQRLTRFRLLQTAIYGFLFLLLFFGLLLPLDWYTGYYRETSYGLSKQSAAEWLADMGKTLAVQTVIGSLLIVIVYAVIRRAPRTWWLWGWMVVMAFAVIGVAITPVFLTPLFYKFEPVADIKLREKLLTLAHEQHIPADDVYQMDASRNTDRIGAYVAGMLGTTRIVLFDTTLQRCSPQQIDMIMSHEMGHYVMNHIWKGLGVIGALALVCFLVVRWAFAGIIARWPAARIHDIADIAGLPLLLLLFLTLFFLAGPLLNTWSRRVESQADDFGLNVSRQPDAAAAAFLMLGEYRDLDPDPVVEAIFYDHPSGRNRIRNAMEWKKAHRGDGSRP